MGASSSGICGSWSSRATADWTGAPGYAIFPVSPSSSTSPSEYTSLAGPAGSPAACSGLR